MSSASDEDENHWPGYVDALTTMTMMLIFVMMILSIAMFSMSESASRGLVEQIAESAGVSFNSEDITAEELARQVSRKITEKTAAAIAMAQQGLPGEEKKIDSGAEALTRKSGEPVLSERTQALLTLTFRQRAIALDVASQDEIKAFLETSGHLSGESRLELKAYASADAGGISDSRRVAYYRAMNIRTKLLSLGVAPRRINVLVEDRSVAGQSEIVQVFVR